MSHQQKEIEGLREIIKELHGHAEAMAGELDSVFMDSVAAGSPIHGLRVLVQQFRWYAHDTGITTRNGA